MFSGLIWKIIQFLPTIFMFFAFASSSDNLINIEVWSTAIYIAVSNTLLYSRDGSLASGISLVKPS